MGINITQTMNSSQFENRENLRNAAKNLLNRQGASAEVMNNIMDKTIFDADSVRREVYTNPQLSIIKASSQISANNSLKETLKYLKSHASKKVTKEPVLGELWNIVTKAKEENNFKGELYDFEIDENVTNIFAA